MKNENEAFSEEEKIISLEHNADSEYSNILVKSQYEYINKSIYGSLENDLDNLIEEIPFNLTHFKLCLLLCVFCIGDGYIMIATSLVLPEITKFWILTDFEKGFISGSIFLGFMFGSLFSGRLSSRGRRLGFQIGLTISSIGGYFAIYANTPQLTMLCNFLIGAGLGICIPSTFSIVPEISKSSLRSYIMTYVWLLFPLGEILACLVAKYYKIYDLKTMEFKKVFVYRFFIIIFIFPFSFLVEESPKFLMTLKDYSGAFQALRNLLGKEEHKLTPEIEIRIIKQYEKYAKKIEIDNESNSPIMEIFSQKYRKTSIFIFINWYLVSYIYYGLVFVMPIILERVVLATHHGLSHAETIKALHNDIDKLVPGQMTEDKFNSIIHTIILSCIFEIPMTLLNGIVPNIKQIARLGTFYIGFSLCALFSILCYCYPQHITILACCLKSVVGFPFSVSYIYTAEYFPTHLKVTALGLGNFFCRFGGVTTPLINEALFNLKTMLPFAGFGFASFLGLTVTSFYPFETFGRKTY